MRLTYATIIDPMLSEWSCSKLLLLFLHRFLKRWRYLEAWCLHIMISKVCLTFDMLARQLCRPPPCIGYDTAKIFESRVSFSLMLTGFFEFRISIQSSQNFSSRCPPRLISLLISSTTIYNASDLNVRGYHTVRLMHHHFRNNKPRCHCCATGPEWFLESR